MPGLFTAIEGEGLWHPVKYRFLPASNPPNTKAAGLYLGQHPHWNGCIELRADGQIIGEDGGRWIYFDDGELILGWKHYSPERLRSCSTGFSNGAFSLQRQS
jgi:hypothetical protein